MDWLDEIISLYLEICEEYRSTLWSCCQRFSPYVDLSFSDEEVMTIYLSGTLRGYRTKKQIYKHAFDHWRHLFPKLASYTAFIQRVNNLQDAFICLLTRLQGKLPAELFANNNPRLMDSLPIIMAQRGRRFNACVAPELADKNGYCATKKLHYYGAKLHILGASQKGTIPVPDKIGLVTAGVSDIKAYQIIVEESLNYDKFADKAYVGEPVTGTKTYTPVKKQKGQKYLDAAEQLYSTSIAKIRQPVESLFNWIEEKVSIQIASKVRSSAGLIVHVFGKLAAAFTLLNKKFSS